MGQAQSAFIGEKALLSISKDELELRKDFVRAVVNRGDGYATEEL